MYSSACVDASAKVCVVLRRHEELLNCCRVSNYKMVNTPHSARVWHPVGSLLCRYRSCSPGNWKALLFAWSWLALNWAGLN